MMKPLRAVVGMVALASVATLSWGDFVDSFDGPELDPRWSQDISPQNSGLPGGGRMYISAGCGWIDQTYVGLELDPDGVPLDPPWSRDISPQNSGLPAGGRMYVSAGCGWVDQTYAECYNHLETPIDTSENFLVEVTSCVNSGWGIGGNSLGVYWDLTHYIILHWGRGAYLTTHVHDGMTYTENVTDKYSSEQDFRTLQANFGPGTIKFYAKGEDETQLTYFPELDLPREPWTREPGAIMIIGKGYQNSDWANNPDYDSDHPYDPGRLDKLIIDKAMYIPEPASTLSIISVVGVLLKCIGGIGGRSKEKM